MDAATAPAIAVIIPTRDRRPVLSRAIESVLSQSLADFELIVVDDCSADDTAAWLETIGDPRLRWHRFETWQGGNAARNHGVAMSRAPLVTFLDSDDWFLPTRLEDTVAYFAAHPEVELRISSFTSVTGAHESPCVNPEAIFTAEEFERYLVAYCLHLGGSGIAIRRAAYFEIGQFDLTVSRMQDRELLLRAARTKGCASAGKIDWVKHRSPDSISYQSTGQLAALFGLVRRHSFVREKYPELFGYLVAREIINPLFNRRFREARAALADARRESGGGFSLRRLMRDYMRGKRRRRDVRQEMERRFGPVPVSIASHPSDPAHGRSAGRP